MGHKKLVPRLIPTDLQTVDKALQTFFKHKTKHHHHQTTTTTKPPKQNKCQRNNIKHKRRALRLAEKGTGEICLCLASLHTASCKIQPKQTKDAEFTCQNANAENKSLEALQQSYKDGRAMHWHSFYLVNESSGQRSPSGKAFGHSFLTTPLHPE